MNIRETYTKDEEFKLLVKSKIKAFNDLISPLHKIARVEGYIEYYNVEATMDDFIGGLTAELYWGLMEIKDFFVEEEYRNQKLGSRLLRMAIEYAKKKDCKYILLSTFSFQALEFYKKFGFIVIGEIEDYPPNESLYTLRLDLK